jgi:hypothetical protein
LIAPGLSPESRFRCAVGLVSEVEWPEAVSSRTRFLSAWIQINLYLNLADAPFGREGSHAQMTRCVYQD